MNNVIDPKKRLRRTNVVARKSNYTGYEIGPTMENGEFYSGDSGSLGSDVSGSGIFNTIINALSGVATSIWGHDDEQAVKIWQAQYEQEKKTNKLLIGVVIAIIVLAFAFLIIKRK